MQEYILGVVRPWDDDHRVDHNGSLPEFDMGAYEFVNTKPVAEAGPNQVVWEEPNGLAVG